MSANICSFVEFFLNIIYKKYEFIHFFSKKQPLNFNQVIKNNFTDIYIIFIVSLLY